MVGLSDYTNSIVGSLMSTHRCVNSVLILMLFAVVACGGDGDENAAIGADAGDASFDASFDANDEASDGGIVDDAGANNTSTGSDATLPNPFERCSAEELPAMVGARLEPDTFTTAEIAGGATANLSLNVRCFSGPIEEVALATSDPRRFAMIPGFEVSPNGLTVTAEGIELATWLTELAAGSYRVSITASSADETLTEAGLASITIQE